MSSKQQYKDYSTRLKAEIKTLKAENEQLQKQVFRLKMQPKELNMPVVNSRFNWNHFFAGYGVGLLLAFIIWLIAF